MSEESSKSDQELRWLIAEFQELRKETEQRSKGRFLCVTASIAALGAVFSLVAKDPELYLPLLLLTPWLLVVFALIWLDNDYYTRLIGDYVRTTAEHWINSEDVSGLSLGWENYLARQRSEDRSISISQIVFSFYFVGPAVLSLVAYAVLALAPSELPIVLPVVVLVFDVVLLVALWWMWMRVRRHPYLQDEPRGSRPQPKPEATPRERE